MVNRAQRSSAGGGVGFVTTRFFTFAEGPEKFRLESGEELGPVRLAYETYGTLNEERTNAILIQHGFSGDAHAAGYHHGADAPGWWDGMIGRGRTFDTDRFFVISSNVLGSCKGSTGPCAINPATEEPYALTYPLLTINDMVNAQKRLIDHLGIKKLFSIAGGSMGGMQVLQWLASYPEMVHSAISIATTHRHSPQQIAFNEVARQAIMADPHWKGGNYYGKTAPANGLAVARMIGHITYMSDGSMAKKFGRDPKEDRHPFKFMPQFEVEGYLKYRGNSFVKRFDANAFLYLTKAMDNFDMAGGRPLHEALTSVTAKVLVVAYTSDWLYPPHHSREIVKACKVAGVDATYCEMESGYGHDAFLVEIEELGRLVGPFINKLYENAVRKAEHGLGIRSGHRRDTGDGGGWLKRFGRWLWGGRIVGAAFPG
ncbi:MAG: homoserine O-acetyltransferase [Nitrospinae bacterium]|nr:homoserine O-acetyltransferase [Nitrospinota bacterium]